VEGVNLSSNLAFDQADEIAARERAAGIARAAANVKSAGSDCCVD
jgi:hypothetical protein